MVNKKRVERIWQRERLKVPAKQPKRGRLWLNDGSCIRLRPERADHVWSYDFVADRTHDGKAFRMVCIIDELSRESLVIRVTRKLKATDVIGALCKLFASRGIPAHIRSDNVPEFVVRLTKRRFEKTFYLGSILISGLMLRRSMQPRAFMPRWGVFET